jgi:hypothetical protein
VLSLFLLRQQLFLFLSVLIRLRTGQRSATVAQTSIRGLGTARTCVVAGLPRTEGGRRIELRPKRSSRIAMTGCPVLNLMVWSPIQLRWS